MSKTVIIVLIVVGVLLVTCVGGVVIGGGWLASQAQPPEGISVSIAMPPDPVKVGEKFEIVVTVTNSLDRARVVKDIDFCEPLLDGAAVVNVEPAQSSYSNVLGMKTYSMEAPLAAGQAMDIRFTLDAHTPGVYTGDLDVSVDSVLKFISNEQLLRIESAGE